uniref:Coiled-coil domain-containing protein 130 n=1 Tax=Panagrolaimus sp. ES5 TaxID=591445 RepID=A0AC34GSZ6_9BILA
MGERKGQNHYYPPDFNYKTHKNLNNYHGTHALRDRKKGNGVIIIRFEMPFNVWCLGCNNHIGMGVRYNAEKKKIGMYYTTPLYEFQMKCALCPQKFIIRTDPKNFDYEMVDGCRRQEKRFDSGELDNVAPVDRSESLKLDANAMYKREHQKLDKDKQEDVKDTIEKLEWIQERLRDDYTANCALRNQFRSEKKYLNGVKISDDNLKQRLSLEIRLQPESEEDKILAKRMLLYKNLGSGKKCDPSKSSEPISAKKTIKRRLGKRGAELFDSSNGTVWDPSHSKSASILGTMIKPKLSKESDNNTVSKPSTETEPQPCSSKERIVKEITAEEIPKKISKLSNLVDYGSDDSE